jgi:hypothetical protein
MGFSQSEAVFTTAPPPSFYFLRHCITRPALTHVYAALVKDFIYQNSCQMLQNLMYTVALQLESPSTGSKPSDTERIELDFTCHLMLKVI